LKVNSYLFIFLSVRGQYTTLQSGQTAHDYLNTNSK
jgi:hypothetical protein